jgi:hypothetical protein
MPRRTLIHRPARPGWNNDTAGLLDAAEGENLATHL